MWRWLIIREVVGKEIKYTLLLNWRTPKRTSLVRFEKKTRIGLNVDNWDNIIKVRRLEYIQSRSLSSCNSIKTFDFSTLYTTSPHSKLKDRLRLLVQLCFIKKNGQRRYKYLVLGRDRPYFVKKKHKKHSDSTKKFSETDIINMLEFLIDNIFVILPYLYLTDLLFCVHVHDMNIAAIMLTWC